ncbi:hypothetical protein CBR_g21776 [Chara braunii]|uniref:BAR domain-containing protein n=1 Tax=Chara braunii TaxID=69332 RepID=A0A388JUF5_CHABU|nr:hypothetical protein CBR_g21776 [Chara braunii]|eukprot:GBG61431.1 hypothetical protein CBR_g21776 [Chara braunii]
MFLVVRKNWVHVAASCREEGKWDRKGGGSSSGRSIVHSPIELTIPCVCLCNRRRISNFRHILQFFFWSSELWPKFDGGAEKGAYYGTCRWENAERAAGKMDGGKEAGGVPPRVSFPHAFRSKNAFAGAVSEGKCAEKDEGSVLIGLFWSMQSTAHGGSVVFPNVTDRSRKICDMRARYEGLIEASSAVSRCACEFAAASKELANYFTEAFGKIDHSEISAVFTQVGHVQQEVSDLLENFVSDIGSTLISPTEVLLVELRQIEAAKKDCDEKKMVHDLYHARVMKQKGSRYLNGTSNATFHEKELQQAKEDYDEFTMQFGCRMTALEQKKPRSLISQAMKYHHAQTKFFSNGMMSVQSIEPFMRQTAQQNHMDLHEAMSPGDPCMGAERALSDDDGLASSSDMDRQAVWEHDSWEDCGTLGSPVWTPRCQSAMEIKELPEELPPQWSAVLSGLNNSLREIGAESLDQKDAMFAMNTMVMAALESGKVPAGSRRQSNRQSCRPPDTAVNYGTSKSAPLTSAGLPVNMEVAPGGINMGKANVFGRPLTSQPTLSKSGPLLLSPLHPDRQGEQNSTNIAFCDRIPSAQAVHLKDTPTDNGAKPQSQGCLLVGALPRKGNRQAGEVSKSGPLPYTARGNGVMQNPGNPPATQATMTTRSAAADVRGHPNISPADRMPLQQQKAQHVQSQWNQQQPSNVLASRKIVEKRPIVSKSGPLVTSGAKLRMGNSAGVNGFPSRGGENVLISASQNGHGCIADTLNLMEPLPAYQGIPHSCPVLQTGPQQVRFSLDGGTGMGTFKSGPLQTRPPPRLPSSPPISPIASPTSGLSPRSGEVHQLPPPPLNCSDKSSALPPSAHSGVLHPPSAPQAVPQSGALSTSPGTGASTVAVSACTSASPLPPPPLHSLRSVSPVSTSGSIRNKVSNSRIGNSGFLIDQPESVAQPSSPTSTCSSTVTSTGQVSASVASALREPSTANSASPVTNAEMAKSALLSSSCLQNPKFKRSLSFNQTVSYSSGGLVDGGLKDAVASRTVASTHTLWATKTRLGCLNT